MEATLVNSRQARGSSSHGIHLSNGTTGLTLSGSGTGTVKFTTSFGGKLTLDSSGEAEFIHLDGFFTGPASFELGAGTHNLRIGGSRRIQQVNFDEEPLSGGQTWSFLEYDSEGNLPGSEPEEPLEDRFMERGHPPGEPPLPIPNKPDCFPDGYGCGGESAPVTGARLLSDIPADGDYGVDSPIFIAGGSDTPPIPDGGVPNPAASYFFTAWETGAYRDFASFTTPEGIPGDVSNIAIEYEGGTVPYTPGTTHLFPAGVTAFSVIGLDPLAMPSTPEPAPFVYGVSFSTGGPASILQIPIGIPIMGDFDNDGDADGADFLAWQRGETSPPLDPSALAVWQSQYSSTAQIALSSERVPEPSALALLGLSGLIVAGSLRHRTNSWS